jgi:hypothetical protein
MLACLDVFVSEHIQIIIVGREVEKLNLFYNSINNEAPECLSEWIPPTVAESSNYNLRNRHNISQLANRLL